MCSISVGRVTSIFHCIVKLERVIINSMFKSINSILQTRRTIFVTMSDEIHNVLVIVNPVLSLAQVKWNLQNVLPIKALY